MANYYPMMLNIEGRAALVVGGGAVATRKVTSLLKAQAQVTVISPELSPELKQLAEEDTIQWKKKCFTPDDLNDAFLIIAATNSSKTNEQVAQYASKQQLCNIVDCEELSQFIVPSVVQRGPLTIAVSTSGANPKLAKEIKKELEAQYDDSYEDYIEFLQKARRQIIDEVKDSKQKSYLLQELLDSQFLTLTKTKQLKEREQLFEKLLKKGTIQ
ncbi:NAD(P)-binding protein [Rummeliibacillus pycnus]|uniref:NAD(P)-binding protein n=1 Tax=Rummeliibacillus pycnus TaxID=101070 RepID=UPI000C9C6CC5|nr:NAD(P)-binding protein [Rummeliibacillus pycnus]